MYAGVDIGGTKTLVAVLNDEGVITQQVRFSTPQAYDDFVEQLTNTAKDLPAKDFRAAGVGIPGRINREHGIGLDFGHLKWHNAPLQADIERIFHCPVAVENDANMAALSEAMLLPRSKKVLYVTISTGIGTGIVEQQQLDEALLDSEGGNILVEHHGKLMRWEDFASGHAIVKTYGKRAEEIEDEATWKHIARNLSLGLFELIAVVQPDIVIFGGSVGKQFNRFGPYLEEYLKKYEVPLVPIPALQKAKRPEEAVIYGCYDLAKARYGFGY